MKNLIKNSALILLLFVSMNGVAQTLSEEQNAGVTKFIEHVNDRNWEELSESISYPLRRKYPVPAIENKADFIKRHNELFDDNLISMIANSSIENNWSEVGWRGIMLEDGEIWLDGVGNLIGINYQTAAEKTIETELIEADRASLPVFFQDFDRPILQMDTEKFFIRIDQMKDESFRFIGWIGGVRNPNSDPIEIIEEGILEHQGTGGNLTYTFVSDFGKFVCSINVMTEGNSPVGELEIYRDEKLFRSYPAIWLKN
ncbi:MAG: hypothetical protein HRT58_07530 [Crocinitomicaceae bacterium]|nr:hypothetical protein [Flavobacteriales bacterium]NQZ35500.1 hypothetical protein [Crocinitomicaceae bacterium]